MTDNNVTNILMAGVGGQGTLLASEILSEVLMQAGYDVKKAEVHGMAQRGGSVISHVRFGKKVYSSIIPEGEVDVERARSLLAEAGYPDGLDPETGRPLRLTFDSSDTTAQGLLRYRFFVDSWRKLGIDVEIQATNYNQFQKKIRDGAYQVFMWGWVADYPDPENFYFLLTTEMARSVNGGPNSANFKDEHFDEIFEAMRVRPNDPERLALVRELRGILEWERPWIELFHPEDYTLFHQWLVNVKPFGMSYPMNKYRDLDPSLRVDRRLEWNRPVTWPVYALVVIAVVIVIPGIVTFYRERQ